MRRSRFVVIAVVVIVWSAVLRAAQIGVNLEAVRDYAKAGMFVDMVKSARGFGSADAPWDEKCKVDKDGWPTEDCGVLLATDTSLQAGAYAFSFTGHGEVSVNGAAVEGMGYDRKKNLSVGSVTIGQGADSLYMAFRNTGGGIKNLRVVRPGYQLNTTAVFTKEFLEALKPFSTLRTMDITRTNETKVQHWGERAMLTDATQSTTRGIAWEYLIGLANEAHKDLWINIPAGADDEYVTKLAQLLKDKLDADRVVYVEYSNEVWNSLFPQFNVNLEAAKAEVAAGNSPLNDAGRDKNPYFWAWKRVAKRSVEISELFRKVYSDGDINKRIRVILPTQTANVFMTRMQAEFLAEDFAPPSKYLYGLAGAPYLGVDEKYSKRADLTVDQIFNQSLPESLAWVTGLTLQDQTIAVYHRLHHLSYEGGLGIDGEQSLAAKVQVNKDPRIAAMFDHYFGAWYQQGGELFMYYNLSSPWGKWGSWGLTDDLRHIGTVKYKAFIKWGMQDAPLPLAGATVPGRFSAAAFNVHEGGEARDVGDGTKMLAFLREGNAVDYLLYAPAGGEYVLKLETAAAADGTEIEALVNEASLGKIACANTGDWQMWGWTAGVAIKLEKGQSVLRLRISGAAPNVRTIAIEKK